MSPLINVFFLLCFPPLFCSARNTITFNNPLRDQKRETLVSIRQKYELGFFTPNGRSDNTRYLGIWYYKSRSRTVVWVANRDKPLKDSTGVFSFSNDGNLRVSDIENKSYWSTPLTGRPFVNFFSFRRTVRLMDTGNLVLREEDPNNNVSVSTHWRSFDYPTDTFLPDMKMSEDLVLHSWVSSDDPGTGDFTFQQGDGESLYEILKKEVRYWQNKVSASFIDSDDEALLTILSSPQDYDWRLVMNFTGQIQIYIWGEVSQLWLLSWRAPWRPCSVYNVCGNFGSCNDGTQSLCKCLPGFVPKSLHKWNLRDFSDGCTRKSSERNKNDVFLRLKKMKVSKPDEHLRKDSETDCKMACLQNDKCQGYSYEFRETGRRNCWIWDEELQNLWENYTSGGREIQVRVAVSDIESTRRNCEICGTNIIPYPLSTEPSCGDIMYLSFNCSSDTGQLSFQTNTGLYSVANIKPENRTFSILVQNAHYCTDVESVNRLLQLNQSSMFYVSRGCSDDWIRPKFDGFLEDIDLKEVEIAWRLPPEPVCYASKDCIDWPDSRCRASRNGNKKCQCNASFHWEPSLLNCTAAAGEYKKPKGHTTKEKPLFLILIGITATALVISGAVFFLYFLRRRRNARLRESRRRIQGNQAFRLYDSLKRVKDLISSGEFEEYDRKEIDVPLFNLESILAATNDFSDANMLGQGGFGPVYKGTFPGGQEIAIKRLSSGSGQGLQEFKNEVVLIAKLQHRNLVRLLGYCVEGDEKMLLYEYMPNRSLDSFLFDRTLCVLLNWEIRFTIITGIARGMLYLHQDSRLTIIHRDMKTSNVLLDEEMSPKISDFGLARIFGGKQTETCTKRVVGSYGYMAPEYALDGYFSIKSDVFSFGVVVLEIVSGKRNTGFCQSGQTLSLLGYAWLLWKEDKALYLMDQTLSETCNQNEFLRCVRVGLLCVQEDPCDRPTMSDVLLMLGNETAHVPNPRKPAFAVRRSLSGTASSSSKLESVNELTSSLDQGR